jgi:hypothetical protein
MGLRGQYSRSLGTVFPKFKRLGLGCFWFAAKACCALPLHRLKQLRNQRSAILCSVLAG